MADYYDRSGEPMTMLAWAKKFEDESYKRVAKDDLGTDVRVSTVWLGLDHNWGSGPPRIFETMIFGGDQDQGQWRWINEAEARAGHDRIVAALRAGEDPDAASGGEQGR